MESLDAEVRRSRYIVCRLILDCLRLIDKARVHSGQLTNNEMIIGMAVIILENEGRTPGISKLSFYTGVPRATVARIVDRLVAMGAVTRAGRKVQYAHPVDEAAIATARRFWVLIDEAAQQLALLEKIAPQKVALFDKLVSQKSKMGDLPKETPKMGS